LVVAAAIVVAVYPGHTWAQDPDPVKARLAVGAAFLKAGDLELATTTFRQVLDADATNWQARALLAVAYLTANDIGKASNEIERLRVQAAPAEMIDRLTRQTETIQRSTRLRDEVGALLAAGKWQDAIASIDRSELPEVRRNLLRAYVAVLRGEFDEARRLAADPQLADFRASIESRAEAFQVAREKALVALNVLGNRFCGENYFEMRLCADAAPLPPLQQQAWDEIRSGGGTVSAGFMEPKIKLGGFFGPAAPVVYQNPLGEIGKRVQTALTLLGRVTALAPLHEDALHVAVVLAFYSGSRDAARSAAERLSNVTGTWELRARRCREDRAYRGCGVGDDRLAKDLPQEGLVVFDRRARVVRYQTVRPQGWLTSARPAKGTTLFEIPFDQIATIKSAPRNRYGELERHSLLFDFGSKRVVPMQLDFMALLFGGDPAGDVPVALAFKATEDVVHVAGQFLPSAKVVYEAETTNPGGFMQALSRTAIMTAASLGTTTSGQAVAERFQQVTAQQQQENAVEARRQGDFWRAIEDLKGKDGQSMADAAFRDDTYSRDLDGLLQLALR
jgi:hypothetical protein